MSFFYVLSLGDSRICLSLQVLVNTELKHVIYDTSLFQIDALPEVVNAVKDREVEVYLDGGVRRGTDVFKALALGAKAVFLGRPIIWGLAHSVRLFSFI